MEIGQILNDKYKISKKLHDGGQASLFLGLIENDSIEFKKKIAIKYFDKNERPFEEFKEEVSRLSELDHPNIANILDVGVEKGKPFLVLDFIDGLNLKELIDKINQKQIDLSHAEVFEILEKVLEALIYAHTFKSNPILHRDISLSNIMISKEGNIKLLDFGISGVAVEKIAGKASYLPLSIVEGRIQYSTRIDLYSLGVVAYELLCKKKIRSQSDIVIENIKAKTARSILKQLFDYKNSESTKILKDVRAARLVNDSRLKEVISKACDENFIVESTRIEFEPSKNVRNFKNNKRLINVLIAASLFLVFSISFFYFKTYLKNDFQIHVKTPANNFIMESSIFGESKLLFQEDLENYALNACENYCYQNLFGASVGQLDYFQKIKKSSLVQDLQSFETYFSVVLGIFDESRNSFEKEQNKCQKATSCSTLKDLYRYIDLQLPDYKNHSEYQFHMKRIIGGGDKEFAELAKSFTDFKLKRKGLDYKMKFIPNGLGHSINKIQILGLLDLGTCRAIGDEAYLVQSRYKDDESKSFNLFDFEVVIFNKKTKRGVTTAQIEIDDKDLPEFQACHYKRSYGKITSLQMLENKKIK